MTNEPKSGRPYDATLPWRTASWSTAQPWPTFQQPKPPAAAMKVMAMKVMAMEVEVFERLSKMRVKLHNAERSMSFDEQRDFAEQMRLLLECCVCINLPEKTG